MPWILVLIWLIFPFHICYAAMPVIDFGALIKMGQQLKALADLKKVAHADMERVMGGLRGLNPLHLLDDTKFMREQKSWSPKDWQSALQGGLSGGVLSSVMHKYQQDHPEDLVVNDKQLPQAQREALVQQIKEKEAIGSQSTYAYNQLQTHLDDISQLRSLITKADTSKAALDLNNRLIAELAYLEVEKLKMQILSNQGLGGQSSRHVLAAAQQVKILHDDGEGDG